MHIVDAILSDTQSIHVVRGDMGTGKTTQIAQLLQRKKLGKIYLVYPSRLLATEMYKSLAKQPKKDVTVGCMIGRENNPGNITVLTPGHA